MIKKKKTKKVVEEEQPIKEQVKPFDNEIKENFDGQLEGTTSSIVTLTSTIVKKKIESLEKNQKVTNRKLDESKYDV